MFEHTDTGTVTYYNTERYYGFIKPDGGGKRIFFHHSQGDTLTRHKVEMPIPKRDDRVSFSFNTVTRRATAWTFVDIRDRVNTLRPEELELARRILGKHYDDGVIEIWDTLTAWGEPPWHMPAGLEIFQSNPGPQGTFHQVLRWCRYFLAEHGHEGTPPLQRWRDMPRYSVRFQTFGGGPWLPINMAWYTPAEADAFAAHLRAEGRYGEVRVLDLWPDAPALSVSETMKVLATAEIVEEGTRITWVSHRWEGHPAVVAWGDLDPNASVTFNGLEYRGRAAERLRWCGRRPE
jgi:cold shock CspA family protein